MYGFNIVISSCPREYYLRNTKLQGNTHGQSPQEKYIAAVQACRKVNPETIDDLFKQLPPAKPDQLLGEWNGGYFDTGHEVANQLEEINWVGKSFKSLEDVDPVIIEQDGKRVSWGQWGFASVSISRS